MGSLHTAEHNTAVKRKEALTGGTIDEPRSVLLRERPGATSCLCGHVSRDRLISSCRGLGEGLQSDGASL